MLYINVIITFPNIPFLFIHGLNEFESFSFLPSILSPFTSLVDLRVQCKLQYGTGLVKSSVSVSVLSPSALPFRCCSSDVLFFGFWLEGRINFLSV